MEKLLEVIADLRQPSSTNLTLEGGSDFSLQLGVSYLELLNDPDTLLRCLTIACELARELTARRLSPALRTLMDTLVRKITCDRIT